MLAVSAVLTARPSTRLVCSSCRHAAGTREEAFQAAASSEPREEEETSDRGRRGRPGSHHRPSPEEEKVSDSCQDTVWA